MHLLEICLLQTGGGGGGQGWCSVGAVVRALASHQCGPGLTPARCHIHVG